jgi:hypothetical protein
VSKNSEEVNSMAFTAGKEEKNPENRTLWAFTVGEERRRLYFRFVAISTAGRIR